MGDPLRYRTKDEVEKWRQDDPIGILEHYLLSNNLADKDDLETIDDKVEQEMEVAVQFAEASPFPAAEELFSDIYAEA